MKAFANLITSLDQTNKTNQKVEALKEYFKNALEEDKIWALALFTHRRPKRKVNSRLLKEWVIDWTGIPEWLFQESYQVVGDIAETIALLLAENEEKPQGREETLSFYINQLIEIGKLENHEKENRLKSIYLQLSKSERFVFTKLMTGGWRLGVSQNLVTRALSELYDMEKSVVAHKLMGNWTPQSTNFQQLILDEDSSVELSKPYPFYLAYPIENEEVHELGSTSEWSAEWKWDGIRGQLINRNGEISLWSRGEELITDKFPEIVDSISKAKTDIVLDGEVLPYFEDSPLPFAKLQTRIGRKNLSKKILKEVPVIFKAYDLLELDGKDLRGEKYVYRRELLKEAIEQIANENLQLSESVGFNSWKELEQIRKKSRELRTEGFMLKKNDSTYESGRKKGNWWKWKIEPLTIDGVMLYAQKGHGRRAGLYSDYTFAVWDDDKLVPFAKAYSGLTDSEMRKVDSFVKKNTQEKFGPVRTVKPELVFEIAFEGINESNRHKSGVALRFPRIKRWRTDKSVDEANSLTDLKSLLALYG